MFRLPFYIYDYVAYQNILNNINEHSCYYNYNNKTTPNKDYFSKTSNQSKNFIKDLLNLSKNRCYICGFSLETNNTNSLYFEREHIINQAHTKDTTKKCKKNIIPICRICNGKKTIVKCSSNLKQNLTLLDSTCKTIGINPTTCSYNNVLAIFKLENFDFNISSNRYSQFEKIEFNPIFKLFLGNQEYINTFDLNNRTDLIFNNIFKCLYNTNFQNYSDLKKHVSMFSESNLDDHFLDFLSSLNLLNNSSTLQEMKIRDSLIEIITLFQYI